jgi:hypothetical protein
MYQEPLRFARSDLKFVGVYIYELKFAENRVLSNDALCGREASSGAGAGEAGSKGEADAWTLKNT